MNAEQRKTLAAIGSKLTDFNTSTAMDEVQEAFTAFETAKEALKDAREAAATELEELLGDIDNEKTEERDKFDNMPESLQQGERGQAMEAAADAMDEAYDKVGEALTTLRDDDYDHESGDVEQALQEAAEKLEEATA